MRAISAFREAYIQSDWADPESYTDYESRKLRYQILWAWYESTAFRNIHKWAQAYRNEYQLYSYIRNIYNPAFRLVEFWKTMIWGGLLDPEAKEAGSVPIKTDNDDLRKPIAELWKASNWDINKDIAVLWACSMGDVAIRIVDDPDHEEVRLENVHPASIKHLVVDGRGYVKEYQIEETRIKPDTNNKTATYLEVATREPDSDIINFETFADGKPFDWNGVSAKWTEEYGFMPLVAIQHNNVGFDYGWAEMHPLRSKMNDVDDVASKLHDYIRKVIDPVWLFNFSKPKTSARTTMQRDAATTDRKEPGKEEVPALYVGDPNAKGQALVTQVGIAETSQEIQNILSEMERDMPELQMDIWTVGQDVSGKALGKARQRVERKVIQRRPNYDKALVRAHQMAIAIGGEKGYKGYDGYNLMSYDAGLLNHSIPSDRTIFESDPYVEANEKRIMWETVSKAVASGIPIETILRDFGWTDKQLAEFGKQKLAAIKLEQEDVVNVDPDTDEPIEQ